MRILVATDQWFPDRMGGVARIAADTAWGWAVRGHEVVVVPPQHEGASTGADYGSLRVFRVLPRGRAPQTLSDPIATRRCASRLNSDSFDVLVAHSLTTAHGLLSAKLGLPLGCVFHADAATEARFLRAKTGFGKKWLLARAFEGRLRRLTSRSLRAAANVVVLSDFSRGLLAETSSEIAAGATVVPAQ